MKKTFLIIFTLFSMYSYSKIKEKVITSDGQVIVLMEDKTWEYEERFNDIKDFESKIKLSNLEVSAKRSNGRSLTGTITNLNRKKLEYVTYKIKWLIDGEYSTLREFTIKDLAEKIIEMTQSSSKLIYRSLPENDPVRRQPDITLANKILGWKPTVELEEGLTHTINYFSDIPSSTTYEEKPERIEKYFTKSITESA